VLDAGRAAAVGPIHLGDRSGAAARCGNRGASVGVNSMKKRLVAFALIGLSLPLAAQAAKGTKAPKPDTMEAPPAPAPEASPSEASSKAAKLDQEFRVMDANGDGMITRAEFDAAHSSMPTPPPDGATPPAGPPAPTPR
jgi:hypothetical protein